MGTLETERLRIRPFEMGDVDAAFEVLEGHPDVWRFDPGHARTREERAEEIQYRIGEYRRQGMSGMAVVLKATGQFIGYCGLQLYLLEGEPFSSPEVELFYKLGRDFWGQGYATEACQRMLRHAWDDLRLPRIVTWTAADNAPSIALLRRLGMTIEPAPGDPASVIGILNNPRA